jgi:hypothetical protein
MATDLSNLILTARIALDGVITKDKELAPSQYPIPLNESFAFTFGEGALKANQLFTDRRTLAGGASETLDLNGVLENPLGGTVSFDEVKGIVIVNRSDEALGEHDITDAEIRVGGAAANEFQAFFAAAGDKLDLPAGAAFAMISPKSAGWNVVDEYAVMTDQLKIENLDGADEALYDIYIWGESA